MANKPTLLIMEAGMGSRFGGLKQIEPIDENGQIIIDFSLYDAYKAGFRKVVFIIKEENLETFRSIIDKKVGDALEIVYVFQKLDNIPQGFSVPEGREKPWGTAHAVLCAAEVIDGPFAVINADDFYGADAFKKIYDFLQTAQDGKKYNYAMVGYELENTLTENGTVSRGVCEVNRCNMLKSVVERTKIAKTTTGAAFSEDDGESWIDIDTKSVVSMNFWGFSESFFAEAKNGFAECLEKGLKANPLKCEYFLPSVVSELLEKNKAGVKVLKSSDKWYGITYKQDKQAVTDAIRDMVESGKYPEKLW